MGTHTQHTTARKRDMAVGSPDPLSLCGGLAGDTMALIFVVCEALAVAFLSVTLAHMYVYT